MTFKSLVVSENEAGGYISEVCQRQFDDLPDGEVLIKVQYSSLNFKDALSATGNKGVTRNYPHTPGIDAAGIVEQSQSSLYQEGDQVLVTGFDLGMNTSGGFSEYIRVPADWVVRCPNTLGLEEAMALGTAGLTAGLCVDSLLQVGITPDFGPVLVTGSSGGVGSISIALLSQLGFEVNACTGRVENEEYLKKLGAEKIIPRSLLMEGTDKPLLKEQWGGVVDTVGGDILFNAIKSTRYGGSVSCCGMAASSELSGTVFPFILRGVNLLGIDSVNLPLEFREYIWEQFAVPWRLKNLKQIVREIDLEQLPENFGKILSGNNQGRLVVRI